MFLKINKQFYIRAAEHTMESPHTEELICRVV